MCVKKMQKKHIVWTYTRNCPYNVLLLHFFNSASCHVDIDCLLSLQMPD